jgi:hypothetical protein
MPNTTSTVATVAGTLPIGGGTLTGNLLFTDNTLDIGATGATRPRAGYFGTALNVQSTSNQAVFGATPNFTTLHFPASSGAVTVTMPNTTSTVATTAGTLPIGGGTLTGNLLFTDNTLDIGATGATRPRTGYFGTGVNVQATTNQLKLGAAAHLTTISSTAPSAAAQTLTIPDMAGSYNVSYTVFTGSQALGTGAISANACATAINVAATGVLSTDNINLTESADWSGITGYGKASTDGLLIYKYPTTGYVNIVVCNGTGTSITPGAATVNIRVAR